VPTSGLSQENLDLLRTGETFHGLEVLGLLGRGGMGEVYRVRQPALDRIVALKILPPNKAKLCELETRFEREARALATLSHPNIVTIFDFGRENDLYFITMELVQGETLRDRLKRGRLAMEEAVRILGSVLDALGYAHSKGVVHRDIKPENIMIDDVGRVRVADFGLAKLEATAEPALTRPTVGMGTMGYVAPEQLANSRDVDHRADLYASGVLLYESLTGQLPLGEYEPASRVPGVNPRVDEVVRRALRRDPALRYSSAADFAADLRTSSSSGLAGRRFVPAALALAFTILAALAVVLLAVAPWKRREKQESPAPRPEEGASTAYELRRVIVEFTPETYSGVAVHPRTPMIAAIGNHGKLKRFRISDGENLPILYGLARSGLAVAFSPDGSMVAWSGLDGWIVLHEPIQGTQLRRLVGHQRPVSTLAFRPDGSMLASGDASGLVMIWDPRDGRELSRIAAHEKPVYTLAWHPDGSRLFSGSSDGTVRVWDLSGGELKKHAIRGTVAFVVALPQDGSLLAIGGREGIQLLSTFDGSEVVFAPIPAGVLAMAYRADGRIIAAGDPEGWLRIVDAPSGKELWRKQAHQGSISWVAFSSDGSTLVSVSLDKSIKIWSRGE